MQLNSAKLIVYSVKISFNFDNKRIPSNRSLPIHSHPTTSCQRKRLANGITENSICSIWNFELKDEQMNLRFEICDSWFVFKTKYQREQHLKASWRQITCQINNSEYEMSVCKSFKQTIESTFRKFENSFVCIDFICNEMRNIYVNNDFSKSSNHFLWNAAQR